MSKSTILIISFLALFQSAPAVGRTPPPKPGTAIGAAPATATTTPAATGSGEQTAAQEEAGQQTAPEVVASNKHVRTTTWAELDRTITLALDGFQDWAGKSGNDPNNLRLFLAGRMIPNLEPSVIVRSQEYVNFELNITPRDVLVGILTAARRAQRHAVPLSVGLKDTKQPFNSKQFLTLEVYPRWTPAVIGGMIALVLGLVLLGWFTELLRDTSVGRLQNAAFSLAKCQMAFWFAIVIGAYLYIWLVTGDYNAPTESVLALLGISSGTGLAAILLDRGKQNDVEKKRVALDQELAALTQRIAELNRAVPLPGSELFSELQQKSFRLNQVNQELVSLPAKRTPPLSKNFFQDLISDGNGVSFHRFQIVVWTIVLAIVFIRSVHRDLAMPEFDAALLGLMGISSGTYVGFKFPEKPK